MVAEMLSFEVGMLMHADKLREPIEVIDSVLLFIKV